MLNPSFRLVTFFSILLANVLSCGFALAASITVAWNPSSEAVAGYKVYYGPSSGKYGPPIYVGNVTTYTLTGLKEGQTYFIAVTAYNQSMNESAFSHEVVRGPTHCDFNGDGKPDILWRNTMTGELAVWFMDGINMTISRDLNPSPVHTAWKTVGTGDFNGDWKTDIVWRNSSTGELAVWFMDGINMTSWRHLNPSPVHTAWKVMGIGDFNGDDKPDVLWRNSVTGDMMVWFMDGITITSWSYFNPSPVDTTWETVGTGDINGDGKPDVLWRNSVTGEFVVWFMDGITMTSWSYLNPSPVDTTWETVGVEDFDGDRKADILLRNRLTGEFVAWSMDYITMAYWRYFNPSPIDTAWVPLGSGWNLYGY